MPKRAGTYVTRQTRNGVARYYVGVSEDIDARVAQHRRGVPAGWAFEEEAPVSGGSEQEELLTRMLYHGFDRCVRAARCVYAARRVCAARCVCAANWRAVSARPLRRELTRCAQRARLGVHGRRPPRQRGPAHRADAGDGRRATVPRVRRRGPLVGSGCSAPKEPWLVNIEPLAHTLLTRTDTRSSVLIAESELVLCTRTHTHIHMHTYTRTPCLSKISPFLSLRLSLSLTHTHIHTHSIFNTLTRDSEIAQHLSLSLHHCVCLTNTNIHTHTHACIG